MDDMQKVNSWHEEDAFWEATSSLLFGERLLVKTSLEIENVLTLLGVKPKAYILDLCCGVGRHSLELARRGFKVIGVDRTSAYLEKARKQAQTEGLKIEFIEDDMRNFCRPDAFDVVINMFTSFGYFEDPEDDRKVVMNVYQSLRSGGVFLLDVMGKEVLARIFQERSWNYEEDGSIFLEERKVSQNWGWIENNWISLKDEKKQEFKFSHRIYSASELDRLLKECGFKVVNVYGDLTGATYDHTAKRLILLAHK